MAHSLFEPAPQPFTEKLWRRMRDFHLGFAQRKDVAEVSSEQSDPALAQQATGLDARGRQQLLEAMLTAKPIAVPPRAAYKRSA
ncbi:hypothetical protein FIU93_05785 [Labrenzia sp. THAF35]|uniref:hypothetical protein n=1 Tax=Labrenzia sp. THAF35 TaxID=2587854 RepID=UPI001267B200|nr:hypothetical protein [Labrenzia sp. THAF35]QFT66277.1 hypothetical protein FIU93_05785 [Labrenzia sp. THAF35]